VRTSLGTSGSDPRNLRTVGIMALLLPICARDAGMRASDRAVCSKANFPVWERSSAGAVDGLNKRHRGVSRKHQELLMKRPGIIAFTVALAMALGTTSWAQSGGAGGAGGGAAGGGTGASSGAGGAGTGAGTGMNGTGMNSNGTGMNSNGMNGNNGMNSATPGSNPGLNGNHSGPGGINTNNQ
jgi:hypothetical protein